MRKRTAATTRRTTPTPTPTPPPARRAAATLAAAAAGLAALALPAAHAATYTWQDSMVNTTGSGTFDWFTGGPNTQGTWDNSPGAQGASLITNADTVQFFTGTGTAFTNTLPVTQTANVNNGGTAVQLKVLTLTGKASATAGANLIETISGDALNFSAATGTVNLNAVKNGNQTITYNLESAIQLGTDSSANALTFTGNGSGAFNVGGVISELQTGGGSVTKAGTSTLTLSGNNSYTGATTVNAGTLIVNGANTGTGAYTVNTGGILEIGSTTTVGNTSGITINGGGILKATGAYSTVTGWLTNGKIAAGSAGAIALTGNSSETIDMAGFANLSLGSSAAATYSGTLTPNGQTYNLGGGSGGLTVSSVLGDVNSLPTNLNVTGATASVILSNTANTYTGVTTITGGANWFNSTVQIAKLTNGDLASSIGASSNAAANFVLNQGKLQYTGTYANGATDRLFSLGGSGASQVAGNINFTNTGAIGFSDSNTANTLILGTTSNKLYFAPRLTDNGGGMTAMSIQGGGNNWATVVATDNVVTLANATSSYTGSTSTANGNGTYYAVTKLADGGSNSSIGASTNAAANWVFNQSSAVLYIGSGDSTDRNYKQAVNTTVRFDSSGAGALVMSGAATFAAANGTQGLTLTGTSAASLVNEYNGAIADNGMGLTSVTKSGTNTWALGGTNSYTGPTAVNAGKLLVNGDNSAATGAVTVASTATLGGSGTIGGAVTVQAGGKLAPGTSPGQLTVASLALAVDSTTQMEIGGATLGTGYDNVTVTAASGGLTYGGLLDIVSYGSYDVAAQPGSYTLFSFTGSYTGEFGTVAVDDFNLTNTDGVWSGTNGGVTYTFTDSTGVLNVVPEPAALALLCLGAVGLLRRRRGPAGQGPAVQAVFAGR